MISKTSDKWRHNPTVICVTVVSAVLYCLNIFFSTAPNILAGSLFNNSTRDQSAKYDLWITPMGWTFSIWGVIFLWNILWFVYGIAAIFRKGIDNYLYLNPGPISIWTYLTGCFAFVFTLSWVFAFDNNAIWGAFVVLLLTVIFLYITLFFSMRRLADVAPKLRKFGFAIDVPLVWVLHINGLGIYATWCTVATNLNFSMVFHYVYGISMQSSCFVALGLLTVIIVTWVLIDLIFLDRWSRHLLSPHLTLVWALTGSLMRHFDLEDPLKQHTLALLVLSVVASVVKIFVMIWRGRSKGAPVSLKNRRKHKNMFFLKFFL